MRDVSAMPSSRLHHRRCLWLDRRHGMSLFVSGALRTLAYWTISGEAILYRSCWQRHPLFRASGRRRHAAGAERRGGQSSPALWPRSGARLSCCSPLGLMKGLADYVAELWHERSAAPVPGQCPLPAPPFAEPSRTTERRMTGQVNAADRELEPNSFDIVAISGGWLATSRKARSPPSSATVPARRLR